MVAESPGANGEIEAVQLFRLLCRAWGEARTQEDGAIAVPRPGQRNGQRSRAWVSALGKEFRRHYEANASDVWVLWANSNAYRAELGLNELLFDVHVVRVGLVDAPFHNKKLPFARESIWAIESEMSGNGREVVRDFSKLVLSAAKNKLFVASAGRLSLEKFLETLAAPAQYCTGCVYLCLIPHPGRWDSCDQERPSLYRWEGHWVAMASHDDGVKLVGADQ